MPDIEDLTAIPATADGDLFHAIDVSGADVDPKDKKMTFATFRDTYLKTGLRNIVATTAPGVSNDDSEGYQVGSAWFDVTADTAYFCLDASTGAAKWNEAGASTAGVSPLTTKGDVWGYSTVDARVPVGTDGQVLKADSSDAEGVAWAGETVVLEWALGDETTDVAVATAVITDRVPFAFTLTDVRVSFTTAGTTGVSTIDINKNGTTVLSTKLTVDSTEETSTTAATPPVISVSAWADDDEVTIDVDGVSTTAPKGAKVRLIGTKP